MRRRPWWPAVRPGTWLAAVSLAAVPLGMGQAAGALAPEGNGPPSVIGIALSGRGTSLLPPARASYKPYSPACHDLQDRGFGTFRCVVARAPDGTIAGVTEEGTGTDVGRTVERDLVWRRQGRRWELVLARTLPGPTALSGLWADDLERDGDTKLVFVTPSSRPGFGHELDVVEGTGQVVLYRYLGQGFAVAPRAGGLVTYVPASALAPGDGRHQAYDQVLIGYLDGAWRVLSQQYVPRAAALSQHRGAFSDLDPSASVAAR